MRVLLNGGRTNECDWEGLATVRIEQTVNSKGEKLRMNNQATIEQRLARLEEFAIAISESIEQMVNAPAEIEKQMREIGELAQHSLRLQSESEARVTAIAEQNTMQVTEMYNRISERLSYLEERV